MDKNDARKYFDEWLSSYCNHLHVVRQGTGIDLAPPAATKSSLTVSTEQTTDPTTAQRKPSA